MIGPSTRSSWSVPGSPVRPRARLGGLRAPSFPVRRRLYRCPDGWSRTTRRSEGGVVSMDLLGQARAGDGEAFGRLVDPYRRELQVHCYRLLGSLQDAEDTLHDTLVTAWQGLAGFEGRASVRTWLYRVATSRCGTRCDRRADAR